MDVAPQLTTTASELFAFAGIAEEFDGLCNTLLSKANRRSITNMVFRNLLFYR
jgi:hypothetical protein